MELFRWSAVVVMGWAVAGCGKVEATATEATPTSSGAAAAGAVTCSPEHTDVAEGGFCIAVPKDWKLTPEVRGDITEFRWLGKDIGVSVTLNRKRNKVASSVEFKPKNGEKVTQGDMAGGKGKWALMLGAGGEMDLDSSYRIEVVGPNGLLTCNGSTSARKAQLIADVCKTIVPK